MARTKNLKRRSGKKVKPTKKPSTSHFTQVVSILLIGIGALTIYFASSNFVFSSRTPQSNLAITSPPEYILNKPVKIFIPKLSKELMVSDGHIENNRWTISATGVSYLTSSSLPGKTGNSVLYGHNLPEILGNLYLLAPDDKIYVILNSGKFVEYKVAETREVTPEQVEILDQSDDARLTLYTCSGFLDEARFVVVAKSLTRSDLVTFDTQAMLRMA